MSTSPTPFSAWFAKLSPEERQAWRDHLAAIERQDHSECEHPKTRYYRRKCRAYRARVSAEAAQS